MLQAERLTSQLPAAMRLQRGHGLARDELHLCPSTFPLNAPSGTRTTFWNMQRRHCLKNAHPQLSLKRVFVAS